MPFDRERLRRFRITLRVSADERRTLASSASRAGLCLSAFMRFASLGAKPPRAARRPSVEVCLLSDALASIGAVASSLHQIANAITSSGCLPSTERDLRRALADVRPACAEILRALVGREGA